MSGNREFSIGLCSIGNCSSCMYSCCLPACAMASARNKLDGSSFCFNLFCLNSVASRNIFRSAYGIPGSAMDDCLLGTCCGPCVINQLYQTAEAYGPPQPNAGPASNVGGWTAAASNENCMGNCLYAFFCPNCAVGSTMEKQLDMPCLLGCCYVTPCLMQNLTRYQYRIGGNDCMDDCCTPVCVFYASYMCPCSLCCTMPYFLNLMMKPMAETEARSVKGGHPRQYLANGPGTVPTAPPVAAVVMTESPMVK